MKVLLFCARGFETMEFSVFVDVMGWPFREALKNMAFMRKHIIPYS